MPAPTAVPLRQVLASARRRLAEAGFSGPEAAIDVDLFARTILGWDRAQLITAAAAPAPDALEPRFSEYVERRATREPAAYILGLREFWGLDFEVSPAVLVPRPETEFVVEEALHLFGARPDAAPGGLRLADIGTGSGCIAVALARELRCTVVATDVSPAALAVAGRNAARHGVGSQVALVATRYLDGLSCAFDLIAANPPYVREGDRPALAADVRHEPEVALFGGSTGLRDIEGVLAAAAARLRPGGHLVMEFGFGQEADVLALVEATPPLRVDRVREDLQGIPRTAVIRRGA
jgi:release factor glutamine methyltransferase